MAGPTRSLTGNMPLLPAVRPGISERFVNDLPTYSVVQWTFGYGSVIWKIWPTVLFYTLFSAAICSIRAFTIFRPQIPMVMLTVLGVVIGFVISYRAMSGYDRYWMGRSAWTEIIRTCRTTARVIHYHVPPRLTPKTPEELQSGKIDRTRTELMKCVNEKNIALDMIAGFAFATKHHLRGELGIYYEDLYPRVRPLHDAYDEETFASPVMESISYSTALPPHRICDGPMHRAISSRSNLKAAARDDSPDADSDDSSSTKQIQFQKKLNVEIPAGNDHQAESSHSNAEVPRGENEPLLPSHLKRRQSSKGDEAQLDLVPFGSVFSRIINFFKRSMSTSSYRMGRTKHKVQKSGPALKSNRKWGGPVFPKVGIPKGEPRKNATGEIVPLEICRCLSDWCAVLEERGTVGGASLGSIMGGIAQFESSLSTLEQILTTPLPFGYAVHIRHTVWIYLFFLPFQLVEEFQWYTVLTVAITAFIFMGFVAAGEEIEQPFEYDENDLDLDLFCQEIVADEIDVLKHQQGLNSYFPHKTHHYSSSRGSNRGHGNNNNVSDFGRRSMTLVNLSQSDLMLQPNDPYNLGIEGSIVSTAPSRSETVT